MKLLITQNNPYFFTWDLIPGRW